METDGIMHWLHLLEGLLPLVVTALGGIVIVIAAVLFMLHLKETMRLLRQEYVFLELTPPAQTARTPEATQRLFSVLHGLYASRSLTGRVMRQKPIFSLEVVSSREQGIRYIMRVPLKQAGFFEQAIASYLPSVQTRRIKDYLPTLDRGKSHILDFKQTGHFAYPLQTQSTVHASDPVAYLTGMMTKLSNNEMVTFQLVVIPARVRSAEIIGHRLLGNEELLQSLGKKRIPVMQWLMNLLSSIFVGTLSAASDVFHGPSRTVQYNHQREMSYKHDVAAKIKPARVLSAFEQDLAESVNGKIRQPLYRASIRAMIVMQNESDKGKRVEGVRSALSVFSIPGYQSLKARHNFPAGIKKRYRAFLLRSRLPAFWPSNLCVLSAAEIGSMYHFPASVSGKTENIATSLSKVLPATIDLKRNADAGNLDVILGRNVYHGTTTNIGLTAPERERHVYIIGGTGNGKTTMMQYGIIQDIRNGKGVAVVDPHGDLARTILKYIPEERMKDVIYFNPRDYDYPVGLNLLELPEGLTGSELENEKDRTTEAIVSVLRKIFSEDDSGGHRIEYVLRNTIHTAMTAEGATIFTILKILTNKTYRKDVIKNLKDEDLIDFWKEELGRAGDMQRVKMSAGVTNKIGRFRSSVAAKRVMSQSKSTINFDDIINSGKILICNFAKGAIGEDTSTLFGTTVLAKLQLAAQRREDMEREDRRPFYVYVDEFQNFATTLFLQVVSEARKYNLFLTMAEQSTTQQEEMRMSEAILNNVGTVVCFRTGSSLDIHHILPRFQPYIEQEEIINLPSYNFYIKLSGVKPQEPVSGETILPDSPGDKAVAERIIESSRNNYATKYEEKPEASQKTKPEQKDAQADDTEGEGAEELPVSD